MGMSCLPLHCKLLNINHNEDSASNFPVRTYSHSQSAFINITMKLMGGLGMYCRETCRTNAVFLASVICLPH